MNSFIDDRFECRWMIVKGGYLIETIPAVEGHGLLFDNPERRVIRRPSGEFDLYDPMLPPPKGVPLLFRTFADLEETEGAILEFANRFGMLTDERVEDVGNWFTCIKGMRSQIEMVEAGAYRSSDWSQSFGVFAANARNSVGLALVDEGGRNGMALKVQMPSLWSALWAQLGMWIERPGIDQRKCGVCGHWFRYGTGTGRRSTANYCRRACTNVANYQKRKEQGK